MSLTGSLRRVVLVTGASQGIGRSIALRLAKDGLDVAVNDIPSKEDKIQEVVSQIHANGGKAISLPADVAQEKEVMSMTDHVVNKLGGLDIMVANAGVLTEPKRVVDTPTKDLEFLSSVNMYGLFWSYKYAAIQMIKQGRGGRIIGAASIVGKQGTPMITAYCMTKFAVRGLTMGMAQELQEYNITVNAYAPGMINTGMAARPDDDQYGGKPGDALRAMQHLPPNLPLLEPEDVAATVSYLARPESHYITGQTISVTGTSWAD